MTSQVITPPKHFVSPFPNSYYQLAGLVKIEIYRKGKDQPKIHPTDNILQQWGEPPDDKENEEDD